MKRQKLVSKAQVKKVIDHYRRYLGLSDWEYRLTIDQSSKGDDVAAVIAVPRERYFYIVFAPRVFAKRENPLTTLEGTVLHELIHVALWPVLSAHGKDDVERAKWASEYLEEPFVDPLSRMLAKYLPKPR